MSSKKIEGTAEAWDEGALGQSAEHARSVPEEALGLDVDESLGLQSISIRLQKSLIDDFKVIAKYHGGIGYQTLMRQILKRFADAEAKRILRQMAPDKDECWLESGEEADDLEPHKDRNVA